MSLMLALYSYSLQLVSINQCCREYERVRVVKFRYCYSLILKIPGILISSEKAIHCWSLLGTRYVGVLTTKHAPKMVDINVNSATTSRQKCKQKPFQFVNITNVKQG